MAYFTCCTSYLFSQYIFIDLIERNVMEVEIDWEKFKLAFPIYAVGFALLVWQDGFFTALGVTLICMALGVRRI